MSDVIEQSPVVSDASTWFDLGCTLQDAEQYQEALSAFTQAQAIDPNYPDLQNRIGAAHFLLQNFTAALDVYEAMVCQAPGDVRGWANLSISAHRRRQWDKSLAAAQRAFEIDPNDSANLYHFGLILREVGRFKRARHLLNRAISLGI